MSTRRSKPKLLVFALLLATAASYSGIAPAQEISPPIRFFNQRFDFGKHKAQNGDNVVRDTISVKRPNADPKAKVVLALCGFDVRYSDSDHHLTRFAINIELAGPGPYVENVPVKVSLSLGDKNGDDQFEGHVTVGVIVVDSKDIQVYTGTKPFPQKKGSGPMKDNAYVVANQSNVDRVTLISGFDIRYGDSDHHVLAFDASAQAATLPYKGAEFDAVTCELGLRDSSGDWDDLYGGSINFSMLRFAAGSVHFDRGNATVDGKGGPKSQEATHSIETTVKQPNVFAALSGIHLGFIGKDHDITRLASSVDIAKVAPAAEKTVITVRYTGGIKDKNDDDPWRCRGEYVVFASK